MKNLAERLNLSAEKPQDGKEYHQFEVNKQSSVTSLANYVKFCFYCDNLNIILDDIEHSDFVACLELLSNFCKNKKQEINTENIDYVTCYFWVGGE